MSLAHLLVRHARLTPERPAILCGAALHATHGQRAARSAGLAVRMLEADIERAMRVMGPLFHCLARIARFKRPKRYVLLSELPKNNYGKVLKTALRATLAAQD